MSSTSINSTISEVFENTKDAILVQNNLGGSIPDNFVSKLHVKANKTQILGEAKRLQAEIDEAEKHKPHCCCGEC